MGLEPVHSRQLEDGGAATDRRLTEYGLREALERDPQGFKVYVTGLILPAAVTALYDGLERGKRWAVRLALQVAGWVDARAEFSVAVILADKLGVRDLTEAQSYVRIGRSVASVGVSSETEAVRLLQVALDAESIEAARAEELALSFVQTQRRQRGAPELIDPSDPAALTKFAQS